MFFTTSLVAFLAFLQYSDAAPGAAELNKRVIATSYCFQDNLYRSFTDPKTSASASSFCSTYVQSTVSTAATTTTTVTVGAVGKRGNQEKRALAATTQYPASRLSSACSCILTAKPTPTTVYTTITSTITSTSTSSSSTSSTSTTSSISSSSTTSSTSSSSSSSSDSTSSTSSSTSSSSSSSSSTSTSTSSTPAPTGGSGSGTVVKNGDFETGSLAPWTITQVYPGEDEYLTYGVTKSGDASTYAFTVRDDAASSYVEVDLSQTLTVSPGTKYNFAARYFMTDAQAGPQTYVIVQVGGQRIAQSNIRDAHTPARYVSLSGSFTAGAGGTAVLTVRFIATDYLGVTWGLDNVVVTPALP